MVGILFDTIQGVKIKNTRIKNYDQTEYISQAKLKNKNHDKLVFF